HTVVVSNLPFGHIDLVRRAPGGVEVAGWVIDPDTAASTHVHAYVDRAAVSAIAATGPRPDVARVHPGYGAAHGFRAVVPAATGRVSTFCLYGINVGPGSGNPVLGCGAINLDGNPFGHLDFGQGVRSDTMVIGGWVIDPDVADPTHVHVYVDGVAFGAFGAAGDRPDVGRIYPGYGSAHGFRVDVRARRDQHVCVYAINARGPGHNVLLGCRIDPTTGRPPPPGEPAPPFTSAARPATLADVGQAWRPGCPVGVDRLSLVTVSYWGFDGGAVSGALVVHRDWAPEAITVFRRLYEARFQIHRIEPITEYSGPGDERPDHENITSAFICRPVTGRTEWSQHSYGWAVDINPVQNPYVNGPTIVPDPEARDYLDRAQPAPAMVHTGDAVVQAFAAIGWAWGGDWRSLRDYMHFSATGR
ncbi:MAG: M15 family metallopeptidase, partial [Acidimicrobiales bacterium]